MLRNTRAATEALIRWLITAIEVSQSKKPFTRDSPRLLTEQLATSVLIAGDRGFGKTTVLLSAAQAFQKPDEFIPPPRNGERWAEGAEELHKQLKLHQNSIVWLDPLDMEPLPPDANLLATLLVRVQNSLRPDWGDGDGEQSGSALLAEEGMKERDPERRWAQGAPPAGESGTHAEPRPHGSVRMGAASRTSSRSGCRMHGPPRICSKRCRR